MSSDRRSSNGLDLILDALEKRRDGLSTTRPGRRRRAVEAVPWTEARR